MYIHVFFEKGGFAANVGSIAIDSDLHVKLYYKGFPIPLPEWIRKGSICKLKFVTMLANFASYSVTGLKKRQNYFNALMQRYTSRQAYNALLDESPLPSFPI